MRAGACGVLAVLGGVFLAGCQTAAGPAVRAPGLAGETVLRSTPAPAEPGLKVDDLLAMARRGAPTPEIVARFDASGVRFDLTPTQVVDLAARGMPLPVLDAIYESRERAVQNQCAQRLVDLDRQCTEAVQRERRRALVCPDPYWPGRPGRGGIYWGW